MVWFRSDDSLLGHPKVLELKRLAPRKWKASMVLWHFAGLWSSRHLTDGSIPVRVLFELSSNRTEAELLVKCGLWHRSNDGFQFHDWPDFNPTKTEVITRRERTRAKVENWRKNRSGNPVTEAIGNPVTNPAPGPTRPDPIRSRSGIVEKNSNGGVSSASRARDRAAPPSNEVEKLEQRFAKSWASWTSQRIAPARFTPALAFKCDEVVFDSAVHAFASDCERRGRKPSLRWLFGQFDEWAAEARAAQAATANGKRAHRDAAIAAAADDALELAPPPARTLRDAQQAIAAKGRKS